MKVNWTAGRSVALVVVFAGLGACGSVGQIEGGVGEEGRTEIDLSGYQRVVVLDMGDGTKGKDVPDFTGSNFADRIAAGSTYFDAVVRFHNSESDELLGELVVDKNSWVLGGA